MRPSILTLSASPPAPRLQPVKWVTKVGPDGYSGCVWDVNSLKLFRFPAVGLPSAPFLRDGAWGGAAPPPARGGAPGAPPPPPPSD
jgi:hypothetical protein